MVRLDTSPALTDYTLDITEEIRVHAPIEAGQPPPDGPPGAES